MNNTVRTVVVAIMAATMAVAAARTAHADPTPPPTPYQIPTPDGPKLPGVQQYPPACGVAPLACALHYDAGTGTWVPPGTDSP
jgi:hypothetical protein